ncbi:hypothetical protein [Ideonella paludis]|uniref:hypothetical protein n=1 Tax=Ideonella paludis TaxID=1233411 RepID=UPI0036357DE4
MLFDPESAYREQIYQTINLLMQQAQVVLYVDQLLPPHQTTLFEAFNGLAVDCKLAVAPHVSPPPGRSLGLSHMVVSLPELLARSARPILWVMRFCPELANLKDEALRTPLFLRMDVLRQLGSPPSAQAIQALTEKCQETTWIESHPDAPLPSLLSPQVRHLLVPSWRWKPNRLHLGVEAPVVHFLARDDQYPLAQELLNRFALLQDALQPGVVITPKPQATGRDGEVKHVSLGALMGRLSTFRPMPACVIDLSGNAYEFETLRESYLRCQVPVIDTHRAAGDGAPLSLMQLIEFLVELPKSSTRSSRRLAMRCRCDTAMMRDGPMCGVPCLCARPWGDDAPCLARQCMAAARVGWLRLAQCFGDFVNMTEKNNSGLARLTEEQLSRVVFFMGVCVPARPSSGA